MDITLRIEVARGRICLSKSLLHAMDDPEFVRLGIDIEDVALTVKKVSYGLRVTGNQEFCISSKKLVAGLCELFPQLEEQCSYRLQGDVQGNIARFPISTLEKIQGANPMQDEMEEPTEQSTEITEAVDGDAG